MCIVHCTLYINHQRSNSIVSVHCSAQCKGNHMVSGVCALVHRLNNDAPYLHEPNWWINKIHTPLRSHWIRCTQMVHHHNWFHGWAWMGDNIVLDWIKSWHHIPIDLNWLSIGYVHNQTVSDMQSWKQSIATQSMIPCSFSLFFSNCCCCYSFLLLFYFLCAIFFKSISNQ